MKSLFVIGDSISCYYGRHLEKMLAGVMTYDRKGRTNILKDLDDCTDGVNGGDSSMVLTYLREVVHKDWFKSDILLLNCGLHDIKQNQTTGVLQVPPELYKENLGKIIAIVREKGISLVWARTTPLNKKHPNYDGALFQRRTGCIDTYNGIADQIMKDNTIPVIDLFTFTRNLGEDIYLNGIDNCHFNEQAAAQQAAFIAGWLAGQYGHGW